MFCVKCGTEITENARYCSSCGNSIGTSSEGTPDKLPQPSDLGTKFLDAVNVDEKLTRIFDLIDKGTARGHAKSMTGQIILSVIVVIIIIAAVYLGETKMLTSDSLAWLFGAILGYLFGRGVGSFDFSEGTNKN